MSKLRTVLPIREAHHDDGTKQEIFAHHQIKRHIIEEPFLVDNKTIVRSKDWFIQTYRRPGFTIEVGTGENPLPLSQFEEIYTASLPILVAGAMG